MVYAVDKLRQSGVRVCFEHLPRKGKQLGEYRPLGVQTKSGETVADVLEAIVDGDRRFRWEVSPEGLIQIMPRQSALDWKVDAPSLPVTYSEFLESRAMRSHGISLWRFGLIRDDDPLDSQIAHPGEQYTLRQLLNEIALADANGIWTAIALRNGEYEAQFSETSVVPTSEFRDVATFLDHRHHLRANERKEEMKDALMNLERWNEPQRTARSVGVKLVYALLEEDLAGFREHFEKPHTAPSGEQLVAILSRHFERSDYREFRIRDIFDLESMSATIDSASKCTLTVPVRRTFSKGKLNLPNPVTFELHRASDREWHLASLTIDPIGGESKAAERSDGKR
jgi:hypothetical protein